MQYISFIMMIGFAHGSLSSFSLALNVTLAAFLVHLFQGRFYYDDKRAFFCFFKRAFWFLSLSLARTYQKLLFLLVSRSLSIF